MTADPHEFSRPVPLARIGRDPFRRKIEARREEREKLARRFGLLALDRLTAEVELSRGSGGSILLEAMFEAEFVQECVISLEPVRGSARQSFALVYAPDAADEGAGEVEIEGEAPAIEPLSGDTIDIGEAVAQELSLALPEFPRDPSAGIAAAPAEEDEERPFAALARWRGAGKD